MGDEFVNQLKEWHKKEDATEADMKRLREHMSMSLLEKTKERRLRLRNEYKEVLELIKPRILEFFSKHAKTRKIFPAVDIGAGHAIGTVTLALALGLTLNQAALQLPQEERGFDLRWYPTDWNPSSGRDDSFPWESLQYLVEESKEEKPFFVDLNQIHVFEDEMIELHGLKAIQYNGSRGIIRGLDPKTPGRYKIQLSNNPKDCKSFKQDNIQYGGAPTLHEAQLHQLKTERKATEFYEGLLERTREIDILKPETWSNLEDVRGDCALVTCTSLLACLGYRNPTAWQDTMKLASQLLSIDGYLLQFDQTDCAGFGDSEIMSKYSEQESLGLAFEAASKPIPWNESFRMTVVLWKQIS